MTIRDAISDAIARLSRAGVETPRLDAELLLAHVLGQGRTYLFAHPTEELSGAQVSRFFDLVEKRETREPLPYLLGTWEFMGLPFRVTPAVLIPRPETEILVEIAARHLPADARVLDVGTGSGCIALSLARELSQARVIALEPSAAALEVARANAQALGVADRITFLPGAFPEASRSLQDLDAVVSNPPYIPTEGLDELEPELRFHEPRAALDGGPDGLSVLGPLAYHSATLLKPGGFLAAEVAMGQAEDMVDLLRHAGTWEEPQVFPDLAGIPRVVFARRRP